MQISSAYYLYLFPGQPWLIRDKDLVSVDMEWRHEIPDKW